MVLRIFIILCIYLRIISTKLTTEWKLHGVSTYLPNLDTRCTRTRSNNTALEEPGQHRWTERATFGGSRWVAGWQGVEKKDREWTDTRSLKSESCRTTWHLSAPHWAHLLWSGPLSGPLLISLQHNLISLMYRNRSHYRNLNTIWFLIRLHNQNMSYQQILNIFLIISKQDNLIMGSHLLTCQNKYQNQILIITTYADGMLKPKSNYIIRTKSEYGLSLCLRHIVSLAY